MPRPPKPQPPKTARRLNCQEPWFTQLYTGTKTVEGRLNIPGYSSLKPGDKVTVVRNGESIYFIAEVTGVREYPGSPTVLQDYLTSEGLARTLPGVSSVGEGMFIYRRFYTQEDLERYGMVAIELKVDRSNAPLGVASNDEFEATSQP